MTRPSRVSRLALTMLVLGVMALTVPLAAQADSYVVSAPGTFTAPTGLDVSGTSARFCGGNGQVLCTAYGYTNGIPTQVRWGRPTTSGVNNQSGFGWTGAQNKTVNAGDRFAIGTFTHINNPVTNALPAGT